MAAPKNSVSVMSQLVAMLLLLVMVLGTIKAEAQSSTCTSELSNLNVCAPFVVPGASNTNPSADCCNALQAVNHDCLCNTLRIASQLPSQCQLQPLGCATNYNMMKQKNK